MACVGGCEGGGGDRGVSTGYRQWTAVDDHASREERDDDEGFYEDAKGRRLRIQVTIVRKGWPWDLRNSWLQARGSL